MKFPSQLQALCLYFILALPDMLQGQNAAWAELIHGQYTETPGSLCRDVSDNVYICGRTSTGNVDGQPFGVGGTYDAFLAKFNTDGMFQWIQTAGGNTLGGPADWNEGDGARCVVYDSISNCIYLAGVYQAAQGDHTAWFGPGIVVNGGRGAFLAKYNLDGTCLWVRTTQNGGGSGIAVDELGQVYLYVFSDDAYFMQNTVFDGASPITLPNGQSVAKYSPDGELLWAKKIGHNVDGNILVKNGHLYFYGGNYGTGSLFMDQPIVENATNGVAILAAMDTSCTAVEWMKLFQSNTNSTLLSGEISTNGRLLLTGGFRDSLFLFSDTLISSGTSNDLLCLFVDSIGNELWHVTMDATGYAAPRTSQALDGSFHLAFTFEGSFTFNGQTITAAHDIDFALARVSPNGTLLGIETNGPVSAGRIGLVTLSDGSPVIACPFTFTIDLGNGHVLTGAADVFVAKLGAITGVQSYVLPGGGGQLLIYANPNPGTCSIELPPELLHEQGLVLRILDAQGQVVQEGPLNITEGTVHLDIRAQATGTYVAEVGNATKRYTGRIVFE